MTNYTSAKDFFASENIHNLIASLYIINVLNYYTIASCVYTVNHYYHYFCASLLESMNLVVGTVHCACPQLVLQITCKVVVEVVWIVFQCVLSILEQSYRTVQLLPGMADEVHVNTSLIELNTMNEVSALISLSWPAAQCVSQLCIYTMQPHSNGTKTNGDSTLVSFHDSNQISQLESGLSISKEPDRQKEVSLELAS